MIKITHGSIFDHKCDLLVIPTSSSGSITSAIFHELKGRGLPVDIKGIPYGSAHFRRVQYENASVLAYAASVNSETMSTEDSGLRKIAKELVRYSSRQNLSLVNIPLLGTGAGGMTASQSFEVLSGEFEADETTTYVIYALSTESLEEIAAQAGGFVSVQEDQHPRVFISYAGTDPGNASWVKLLATELISCGLDARLDRFHLKPGHDLPQWMTNEVVMAHKVLLICDGHYMERANFRKGGVGWETMLIQGDMLAQGSNTGKYIAIVREDLIDKGLPIYLRSKYALNWGKRSDICPSEFEELVKLLYDQDTAPTIGKAPDYIKNGKSKRVQDRNRPTYP